MAGHGFLKRLFLGLVLGIGLLTYASAASADGGAIGMGDFTMETFCDSWGENMADYSEQSNCYSCKIFLLFFDAADEVAGKINKALAPGAITVMTTMSLLWLVFALAQFYGSVADAPNLMEFLTKLGGMMIKLGFAYGLLLGGSALAFDYIINPVLTSAAQLSSQILGLTGLNTGCSMSSSVGGSVSGPMGSGVRSALECMIKKIASGMARSQSIAQGLRCGSFFWKELQMEIDLGIFGSVEIGPKIIVWNPFMFTFGMIMGCLFWFISCLFPMAMLDVIFRIGLIAGMLPLFIVAWVFPPTAGFAKTAWDIFLHSCLVFAITGIIVGMIVTMVEMAWSENVVGGLKEFQGKMESSAYVEAWDLIFEAGIWKGLMTLFIVMAIGVWGLYIAPQADQMSTKFVGGTEFPESCAIKAIRRTIWFIVDVIMTIITILTLGAGACLYAVKFCCHFARTMNQMRKVVKALQKIKQMQAKLRQIRAWAQKAKSAAKFAESKARHS